MRAKAFMDSLCAEGGDITAVSVPRGTVVENVVEIVHHIDADGIVAYPRLVIDADENSEITVVERFVSNNSVRSLVVPVLEVRAAKAARVNYIAVNELGEKTWQIGHQQTVGYRDSMTRLNTIALGGDYARVRAEARLVEQGAKGMPQRQKMTFSKIELNVPMDDARFSMPSTAGADTSKAAPKADAAKGDKKEDAAKKPAAKKGK